MITTPDYNHSVGEDDDDGDDDLYALFMLLCRLF